jgi:hypothetical protein
MKNKTPFITGIVLITTVVVFCLRPEETVVVESAQENTSRKERSSVPANLIDQENKKKLAHEASLADKPASSSSHSNDDETSDPREVDNGGTQVLSPSSDESDDSVGGIQLTPEEMKQITEDVKKEFDEISIPQSLPSERSKRYTLTNDLYAKSIFYLSEVAGKNITPTRESLKKCFECILLHSRENNIEEAANILPIIAEDHAKVFSEAQRELDSNKAELIEELVNIGGDDDLAPQ